MYVLLIDVKKFSVFCRRDGLQGCVFDVELDFEFSDVSVGWRKILNYVWKGWMNCVVDFIAAC